MNRSVPRRATKRRRAEPSMCALVLLLFGLVSLCAAVVYPAARMLTDPSPTAVVSGAPVVPPAAVVVGGALAVASLALTLLGGLLLVLRP